MTNMYRPNCIPCLDPSLGRSVDIVGRLGVMGIATLCSHHESSHPM